MYKSPIEFLQLSQELASQKQESKLSVETAMSVVNSNQVRNRKELEDKVGAVFIILLLCIYIQNNISF